MGGQPSSQQFGVAVAAKNAAIDRSATNKVALAVSVLGGIPGAMAYHSSVVVNGQEFFFNHSGIGTSKNLASHQVMSEQEPQVFDMGLSRYSGPQLMAALSKHFEHGTYDLLNKNCNSFTDCALFFLRKKRLDPKYCMLERLFAVSSPLVTSISRGQYVPNPRAASFDKENVVAWIDLQQSVFLTPGQGTCCHYGDSVDEASWKIRERTRQRALQRASGRSESFRNARCRSMRDRCASGRSAQAVGDAECDFDIACDYYQYSDDWEDWKRRECQHWRDELSRGAAPGELMRRSKVLERMTSL